MQWLAYGEVVVDCECSRPGVDEETVLVRELDLQASGTTAVSMELGAAHRNRSTASVTGDGQCGALLMVRHGQQHTCLDRVLPVPNASGVAAAR
jgi:hypothetical protein